MVATCVALVSQDWMIGQCTLTSRSSVGREWEGVAYRGSARASGGEKEERPGRFSSPRAGKADRCVTLCAIRSRSLNPSHENIHAMTTLAPICRQPRFAASGLWELALILCVVAVSLVALGGLGGCASSEKGSTLNYRELYEAGRYREAFDAAVQTDAGKASGTARTQGVWSRGCLCRRSTETRMRRSG